MAEPVTLHTKTRHSPLHPSWIAGIFAVAALTLSLRQLGLMLPFDLWWRALLSPDLTDMRQIVVHESFLPRLVTCLFCGAQLSLSGVIFQQVLRNPLAEPTTLGVSAGASLALSVTTIFAPQWLFAGQELIAVGGAAVAMLAVVGLAWRQRLAPVALILGGLVVSLYCGSIGAVLTLFNHDVLQTLFIWSAGSLNQNNWGAVRTLGPRLAVGLLLAAALLRPLTMMSLTDESARGLGLSLRFVRIAALSLAVFLGASVVAVVGVIGFLGLLAPAIARLSGARRYKQRLVWAPLVGAALLWFTDQLLQAFPGTLSGMPTGTAMSLLGALLLLWLLPRLPSLQQVAHTVPHEGLARGRHLFVWLVVGLAALAFAVWIGLALGRSPEGWRWLTGSADLHAMLPWRAPRVAAALAAGAILAMAGVIMQRVTGNTMASPEVLGISAGASLGLIALVFIVPASGRLVQTGAAAAGAFVTLLAMLTLGRRHGFAPERTLLAGIALGSAFSALVTMLLASNDPRVAGLLTWMAGSTYAVSARDAWIVGVSALVLCGIAPWFARWLDILPLGEIAARSLGIDLARSRLALLLLAALMTGAATLVIGPLSFIGLMAPHLASMLGLKRARPQLFGAALIGALVMVLADWLGRNLTFPFQIPAGLLATLIGGLYFMGLMLRSRTAL